MRLLILLCPIFLTACADPTPDTVFIVPAVSVDLRTACPVSQRQARTNRDLAVLATEHLNTAQCANEKIEAIDVILTDAEVRGGAG